MPENIQPDDPRLSHRSRLICLWLALGTLAVYSKVGRFDFTNFDDPLFITENPIVRSGLTLRGAVWALTTSYFDFWHPATWLSHMLDCELFGLRAGLHHLVNLGFHIASTLLMFGWLRRMTGALGRSAFVAALFALHPLHVESVAWLSERKDVLSTFFWALSLWTYAGYVKAPESQRSRARIFHVLAVFWFACALMAKAMVVTLPFVLLLLDYWPLGRLSESRRHAPSRSTLNAQRSTLNQLILEKLPFFALSLASCVITYAGMKAGNNVLPGEKISWGLRLANVPVSYVRYLAKTIWPADLAALYPMPDHWAFWQVGSSVLVLVVITVLAVVLARSAPYLIVGWLLFLGTLVPTIGIVSMGYQSIADRYTYVPLIGLAVMVGWGITDLTASLRFRNSVLQTTGFLVIAGCALQTWQQLDYWQNSITLWTHTVRVTGNNVVAQHNLGDALLDASQWREAIRHFREELRLQPESLDANLDVGLALARLGELPEATNYFARALQIKPDFFKAHVNLGIALSQLKDFSGATNHYAQALRAAPDDWLTHYEYGLALSSLGGFEGAVSQFNEALRLNPASADARFQLGVALESRHQSGEAIAQYREALRLHPESPETLSRLAWILATDPDAKFRNGAEAVRLAGRACELTADKRPDFTGTLAAAYAEAGEFEMAVEAAQKACELASTLGQTTMVERNQQLLWQFRNREPYRERE